MDRPSRMHIPIKGKESQQKVFFPNLDALRFICFFLVFLFHSYKTIFEGLSKSGNAQDQQFFGVIEFLFRNGELGVNFFFVLSGFLITFLLIREKEYSGEIHLRNFYLRRVLRIWPMFYLCIFIGFVAVPLLKQLAGQPSSEIASPLHYIFFINNFDYIAGWPSFPDALILIVLWSVAVEEQFYLVWPVILKFIPKKVYPIVFVLIIAGTLVFRMNHIGDTEKEYAIRHFHTLSVIGDMALGALMAYFCSYQSRFLSYVQRLSRWEIGLIYAGALSILFFKDQIFRTDFLMVIERVVIAFFFGMIILEQNYSERSFVKYSRFRRLSKLGLYTYGLYCLHFFVISLVQSGMPRIGINIDGIFSSLAASLIALVAVIIICIFSYQYFEKPFLKLKDRFAIIRKS